VRIGIVFTGVIVAILTDRFMRREAFKEDFIIVMQTAFVVIDEDRSGDMHSIDEAQAFLNAAFTQTIFNLWGDVDKGASGRHLKPKLFTITFHNRLTKLWYSNETIAMASGSLRVTAC